jgi:hypothetical protein
MENNGDKIKLVKKLSAIMEAIGRIEKDKAVDSPGAKFKYLSEEAMKTVIQPLMIEHGVLSFPADMELLDIRNSPKGTQVLETIKLTYEFIDVETGYSMRGSGIGSGSDSTDKASGKAITNALKYVLHSMFLIPTGADPEKGTKAEGTTGTKPQSAGRKRKDPEDPISSPQKQRIFALMSKAGKTVEDVRVILATHGYEHSADIKNKDYDAICDAVELVVK